MTDHDGDGALDVAMHFNSDPSTSSVSVLYGRRSGLPDTADVTTVPLAIANARTSRFVDVTGDRVPELVLAAGSQELMKFFIGLKGQRLAEQYGSGYDPPRRGEERWWGRPWAEVWLPYKLSQGWTMAGSSIIRILGDVGLDGTGDVCIDSHPWLACYNGGRILDSLIDALIYIPGIGVRGVAVLGDIDGSGVNTIAVGYGNVKPGGALFGPGGIRYVKSSRCVPRTGRARTLPEGTDRPGSLVAPADVGGADASIEPNPATDHATVRWTVCEGTAHVSISDLRGRELRRWSVDSAPGAMRVDLSGWPPGAYRVTVRTSLGHSDLGLVVQ